MKRIAFLAVFLLAGIGAFAQSSPNMQEITAWQNVEREMRREAVRFVNDRKRDPGLDKRNALNERLGFFVGLARDDNMYFIAINLIAGNREKYNLTRERASSIYLGALKIHEVLYGDFKPYIGEDGTGFYVWECNTWYSQAMITIPAVVVPTIILMFYEEDL